MTNPYHTTGLTITVGGAGADISGFTSQAVQMAVDALTPHGGGTIRLHPGTFEISAPIRLSSHIELIGSGEGTVLRKIEGVSSMLDIDPGYGQLWVDVKDGSRFRSGMGLLVQDARHPYGWDECTAVITAVKGNRLQLNRRLTNNFDTDYEAKASNACSIIEAVGAKHVVIRDLVIVGGKETNELIGGCRGGAVYLFDVTDALIAHIAVKDFNGDGISWQITERVRVEHCEVAGCTGSGLHPGSRSEYTEIVSCCCHHNGEDGLFVCWMVQRGIIQDNRFCDNGRHGISIGHQDTENLFLGNIVSGNGEHGIYARREKEMNGAHRNRFEDNIVEDNGNGEGAAFYMEGITRDWHIVNNRIRSTTGQRQKYGIVAKEGASFHEADNKLEGFSPQT